MRDRLRRLKQVGAAEESAVSDGGGIVVKRLGDGTMAVFSHPEQAVNAAHSAQGRLAGIEVEGHSPSSASASTSGGHGGSARTISGSTSTSRRGSAMRRRAARAAC
jgi:class 3 adenylate cyclase